MSNKPETKNIKYTICSVIVFFLHRFLAHKGISYAHNGNMLTGHLKRNTCTPAYSYNYVISQSHSSRTMQKVKEIQVKSFS